MYTHTLTLTHVYVNTTSSNIQYVRLQNKISHCTYTCRLVYSTVYCTVCILYCIILYCTLYCLYTVLYNTVLSVYSTVCILYCTVHCTVLYVNVCVCVCVVVGQMLVVDWVYHLLLLVASVAFISSLLSPFCLSLSLSSLFIFSLLISPVVMMMVSQWSLVHSSLSLEQLLRMKPLIIDSMVVKFSSEKSHHF